MKRRDALKIAVGASASLAIGQSVAGQPVPAQLPARPDALEIVDTNVSLFHWPFRRLPLDETDKLVNRMRELGVSTLLAGNFEALLHRNMTSVNTRLSNACAQHRELIPVGSVNLSLPDWETDFEQCVRTLRMPGIRIFPSYHGYELSDEPFRKIAELCRKESVFLQIAAAMEDPRTQSSLVQAPDLNLLPLKELEQPPSIQILNARFSSGLIDLMNSCDQISTDTSRIDGTDGVPKLVDSVPEGRVMLGTHAPFLIPEAALVRTHESSLLSRQQLSAVLSSNAKQFLKVTGP